jgi:hypothetical protein
MKKKKKNMIINLVVHQLFYHHKINLVGVHQAKPTTDHQPLLPPTPTTVPPSPHLTTVTPPPQSP